MSNSPQLHMTGGVQLSDLDQQQRDKLMVMFGAGSQSNPWTTEDIEEYLAKSGVKEYQSLSQFLGIEA